MGQPPGNMVLIFFSWRITPLSVPSHFELLFTRTVDWWNNSTLFTIRVDFQVRLIRGKFHQSGARALLQMRLSRRGALQEKVGEL